MRNLLDDPLGFDEKKAGSAEQHFADALRTKFDSMMNTAVTFSTEAGKKELERLRKATIEAPAWRPSIAAQGGMDAANAHAYAREGQNSIVRDIENIVEIMKVIKTPEELEILLTGGNK